MNQIPLLQPERLLLKPAEAANAIGVGRSKMYSLIASKEVPSVRIGGCVRVPLEALREWVRLQTVGRTVEGARTQAAGEAA